MSFNKDYNQFYNLTLGVIQNIYTNMFTSVLETDFQIDTMLSKSFVDYEPLFFEWCIYLIKFSLYYIIFLCSFEIISFVLNIISLHSMVTKRYIKKYNYLLEHNDYLCFEIEDANNKIEDANNKIDSMKKKIEELNIENKRLKNNYQSIFELVKKIEMVQENYEGDKIVMYYRDSCGFCNKAKSVLKDVMNHIELRNTKDHSLPNGVNGVPHFEYKGKSHTGCPSSADELFAKFELVKKTDDKRTQFPDNIPIPSGPVKKKIIRRAAKKATKTIKELVEQRLV